MSRCFVAISTVLLVLTFFMGVCAFERVYHGKVTKADILQPLESARVTAHWREYQGNFVVGDDSRTCLVKIILTDNNGDWQIKRPKVFSRKKQPYHHYFFDHATVLSRKAIIQFSNKGYTVKGLKRMAGQDQETNKKKSDWDAVPLTV